MIVHFGKKLKNMHITNKIAWCHIPKTGGSFTYKLFDILFDLNIYIGKDYDKNNFYIDPYKGLDKHLPFSIRPELLKDQKRIVNLRKLPDWILSWMMFNERACEIPFNKNNYKNGMIFCNTHNFPGCVRPNKKDQRGFLHIDKFIKAYTENDDYEFIRTSELAYDFIDIIGKYHEISNDKQQKMLELNIVAPGHYDKEKEYFTKSEIDQMYNDCPYWTKLENKIYGTI